MRGSIGCFVVALAACAGTTPPPAVPVAKPGRVVGSVTRDVEVCGDLGGLRAGDAVRFQRRVCAPLDAKRAIVRCALADVGRGAVVRLAGERCVEVRIDVAMSVQPGDTWSSARAPLTARAVR